MPLLGQGLAWQGHETTLLEPLDESYLASGKAILKA